MARYGTSGREHVQRHARRAGQEAAGNEWVQRLARLGYAARGLVYALVGLLALQVALGTGGQTTGTQGALVAIAQAPFGIFLLVVIALGLVGFALWRIIEAVADVEHKGSDAKGLATRAGYVISGLIYGGLALAAARIAMPGGGGGGSGANSTQDWTAWLMAQPFGAWLVGLVGAFIIGFGLFELYRAYTASFRDKFALDDMSASEETWATRAGRAGLTARGITFGIIGVFLINAALSTNPNEARGLGGALTALLQQPFGPVLLGLVAVGLIAYGAYNAVLARYHKAIQQR